MVKYCDFFHDHSLVVLQRQLFSVYIGVYEVHHNQQLPTLQKVSYAGGTEMLSTSIPAHTFLCKPFFNFFVGAFPLLENNAPSLSVAVIWSEWESFWQKMRPSLAIRGMGENTSRRLDSLFAYIYEVLFLRWPLRGACVQQRVLGSGGAGGGQVPEEHHVQPSSSLARAHCGSRTGAQAQGLWKRNLIRCIQYKEERPPREKLSARNATDAFLVCSKERVHIIPIQPYYWLVCSNLYEIFIIKYIHTLS